MNQKNRNKLSEKFILKIKNTNYRRLIGDIFESVRGTEQDFTKGRISRAILLLSIPMVLEMVMESIFAIVDIFFVSKLGSDAVATVGITESLITLVYAIGMGLATGTTAMIARRIGEKNTAGASSTAFQAIFTGLVASMFIAIPGILFAPKLLALMGSNEEMVKDLSGYTSIMLGGNGIIMLLFIMNAIFRSAGDAAIAMRVLWFANIINLILDPCLIFGWGFFPELGIKGAAIATNTGRGLAVVYQLYLLFSGKGRVKLSLSEVGIDLSIIRKLIELSLGGIGQMIIATSSWIGLVRIIAIFGSEVVAGYTIAIRIIIFSLLPSFGISNAAATLVGQNLGAKKPGRAERAVWITGWVNIILMGSISIIFIVIPEVFVEFFIADAGVVKTGAQCLRIISYGFAAYGLGMVLVNSLNGAGDTITPTKINFFCFWLFEIPLAYVLAIILNMKENGVFYSIIIAETVMTFSAYYIFKMGKWKLKNV